LLSTHVLLAGAPMLAMGVVASGKAQTDVLKDCRVRF
jgi:hypothetical protein